MVGSFFTRILVMVFAYAYPAYECFKTVEKNKQDIERLRFWCQYWILIAVITVLERVGDTFLSWLPMYSEAKLAFIIYLWYPKTKGTTYVYDSFFRPYLAKHETEIDRNLLEVRARCADYAVLYWHKAASFGQTRIFEILQYVSAQSTRAPQPTQQRPAPSIPARQPAVATEEKPQPAPTRTSSTGRKKPQADPAEKPQQVPIRTVSSTGRNKQPNEAASAAQEAVVSAVPPLVPAATTAVQVKQAATTAAQVKQVVDDQPTSTEPVNQAKENAAEELESELGSSYEIVKAPPKEKETVMEETTRVRLRKTRSAGVR